MQPNPSEPESLSSSNARRRPEAIPSPLEPESLPRRDFSSVVQNSKIHKSMNNKNLTSMEGYLKTVKDNGFVIENDENIAYDKSSNHRLEQQEKQDDSDKKEELNKLTSVTYDAITTPGATPVGPNLEKSSTRNSVKGGFPDPKILKSITKSKDGFVFEDHRSLEEMT